MNFFEDLIEELKDENLLEQTVTERTRPLEPQPIAVAAPAKATPVAAAGNAHLPFESFSVAPKQKNGTLDDAEFYRQRAVAEVSGLQMVEHVISAIEREHMKMIPAIYNDLTVKKALQNFITVLERPDSGDVIEAEGALLLETEAWCSALAARDANISVGNVRRFCENSRPVLSSQALLALARFYRTVPFSEPVRAKFDFVLTRLFARDAGIEKRRSLFDAAVTAKHVQELYADWSSLALFDTSHADGVSAAAERFRRFIDEAESAAGFELLITGGFFERLRSFKEKTGEMFFMPEVAAVAVDCNVRVGNRFIDLLVAEKARQGVELLEEKYSYDHDTIISSAASKTLGIIKVIKNESDQQVSSLPHLHEREAAPTVAQAAPTVAPARAEMPKPAGSKLESYFGVNRWLLAVACLLLLLSIGVYFWAENYANSQSAAHVAAAVELEGSGLKSHLQTARATAETFYGVVEPTWDAMPLEKQQDLLAKTLAYAQSKGLKQVDLLNNKGRSVAFATENKSEVLRP